ncbi:MAG: hypothetical protein ACLTML_13120 [Blautia faecis]
MNEKIAEAINILGFFCGKRDITELSTKCLKDKYGIEQVDVMVLFEWKYSLWRRYSGTSDEKYQIAKNYIIVGGVGHTTETIAATGFTRNILRLSQKTFQKRRVFPAI